MDYEDYSKKLNQRQVSYFMQCIDLTNAFNGDKGLDEEGRNFQRKMVEEYVKQKSDCSFIDFTKFLGFYMLKEGHITKKEYKDILNGKEI